MLTTMKGRHAPTEPNGTERYASFFFFFCFNNFFCKESTNKKQRQRKKTNEPLKGIKSLLQALVTSLGPLCTQFGVRGGSSALSVSTDILALVGFVGFAYISACNSQKPLFVSLNCLFAFCFISFRCTVLCVCLN